MTWKLLKEPLQEMVLKQAPKCIFGSETSQGEIAQFRIIQTIKRANKQAENSRQGGCDGYADSKNSWIMANRQWKTGLDTKNRGFI